MRKFFFFSLIIVFLATGVAMAINLNTGDTPQPPKITGESYSSEAPSTPTSGNIESGGTTVVHNHYKIVSEHPPTKLGHHTGVGHKEVYREVKSWNPASKSYVDARDNTKLDAQEFDDYYRAQNELDRDQTQEIVANAKALGTTNSWVEQIRNMGIITASFVVLILVILGIAIWVAAPRWASISYFLVVAIGLCVAGVVIGNVWLFLAGIIVAFLLLGLSLLFPGGQANAAPAGPGAPLFGGPAPPVWAAGPPPNNGWGVG